MNGLLIKIAFYTCLAVILYNISTSRTIDGFTELPKNVILIGGNLFSDKDHTRFDSIKENLLRNNVDIDQVISINNKCETLDDFKKNLKDLKRRNIALNDKNTFAFISVGFNDLLNNAHNCDETLTIEPHSSPNAGMSKKLKCYTETEIFKRWKDELNYFHNTFPETKITVLSAYYLPDTKEIQNCGIKITPDWHLKADINNWNADVASFCKEPKRNWGFIAMDKYFDINDIIAGTIDLNNKSKKRLTTIIKRKLH